MASGSGGERESAAKCSRLGSETDRIAAAARQQLRLPSLVRRGLRGGVGGVVCLFCCLGSLSLLFQVLTLLLSQTSGLMEELYGFFLKRQD